MSDIEQYNYRLVWSQPDAEWVGLCDAFPGLSWLEKDQQAAYDGIHRMVRRALDILAEDGIAPPAPTRAGADAGMSSDAMSGLQPAPPRAGLGAVSNSPAVQEAVGASGADPSRLRFGSAGDMSANQYRADPSCGVIVKSTGKPCILKQRHSGRHRSVRRARSGKLRRRYR